MPRSTVYLQSPADNFCKLFEYSPIATLELDYSGVKEALDKLKKEGIRDPKKYFEKYPEAILSLANEIKLVNVNRAALELFEAQSKEEFRKSMKFVFNKESYDVFREEIIALWNGERQFHSEAVSQTATEKPCNVFLRLVVPPGFEDTLSHLYVYFCDISGLKRMEEELKESEAKYRTIVEAAHDAILVADAGTGIIIEANQRTSGLLGIPPDELTGMHVTQICPEEMEDGYTRIFKDLVKKGTLISDNLAVYTRQGERIPVSIRSNIITLRKKKCILLIIRQLSVRQDQGQIAAAVYGMTAEDSEKIRMIESFSRRQLEILSLIASGLSNRQIAARLFLSGKTVETHRARIMQKLGVHNTADLVRYAIAYGLHKDRPAASL